MFALLITAALAAVSPQPGATETPPRLHVSVAGLDLRNPAGIALLDRRIADAARRVCPERLGGDLVGRTQADRCVRAAIAAAAEQRNKALAKAGNPPFATASAGLRPISPAD